MYILRRINQFFNIFTLESQEGSCLTAPHGNDHVHSIDMLYSSQNDCKYFHYNTHSKKILGTNYYE